MSDEYSVSHNFQRDSDDPRAASEYAHRMARVREREADLDEVWDGARASHPTPEEER